MKKEQLFKALFKLCDFCNENKIMFSVTGNTALYLLGVPAAEPESIDIRAYHLTKEQSKKLKELENLAGLRDCANTRSFLFVIADVKIKVSVDNVTSFEELEAQNVYLSLTESTQSKLYVIAVQQVYSALRYKIALDNKAESANYMLNLINILTSL